MLIARPLGCPLPVLQKYAKRKNVSDKNAFSRDTVLTFLVRVPRALGACGVSLCLLSDEAPARDLPFHFEKSEKGWDTYRLTLKLFAFTPETGGVFHYKLLFLRGADTLCTHSADNVTFTLAAGEGAPFSLLAYQTELKTPRGAWGGVIYHAFVDRFAPGGGAKRRDAVYHKGWNEEIMQYPAYPGAHVENNEFFGGTLWGIAEKLPYLRTLGVTMLYLSPIFRAYSNHKYDTADYEEVDLQFGGESALRHLLDECKKYGIIIVLDGVFNHTGDHSRYFGRRGAYGVKGAYHGESSPYFTWYRFLEFPTRYEAWWGIPILPRLQLHNPDVHDYFVGERGILARYCEMGVGGWRLDVADELPDEFLSALRARVKQKTGGNGVIFGEVWENAATKIAYGVRRRYLLGDQLDGVMNYPLREGLIAFARDGDAHALCRVLRELWSSYPTPVCHMLMNLLSTHDTARILTVLGGEEPAGHSMRELSVMRLSPAQKKIAIVRLFVAAALQYTAFGIPSLYYGDEAGLEGYGDPFCRRPFPWGREDTQILRHYRKLGAIRCENSAFCDGEFRILREGAHALCFSRKNKENHVIVAANRGTETFEVCLPQGGVELLRGTRAKKGKIGVPPDTVRIWRIEDVQKNMGKMDEKQKSRK
ncbi:MAG: glycoside hydrolase family 13 protein [Ruminococcaceae bacterium]|nr:glycoside hydrolase family 13 protein [Oscillospiraceae bacterium]